MEDKYKPEKMNMQLLLNVVENVYDEGPKHNNILNKNI